MSRVWDAAALHWPHPQPWPGLWVSVLYQMRSHPPAPPQETLESKMGLVRKPDLQKTQTSIPNSVWVCQAEGEQAQKPEAAFSRSTRGAVLFVPSSAFVRCSSCDSGRQGGKDNEVWVQSGGEHRCWHGGWSEQAMSREGFLEETVHLT